MRVHSKILPQPTPKQQESADMAHALYLTGKHVYEGTVPAAEKHRRRAANRRARQSRQKNRSAR